MSGHSVKAVVDLRDTHCQQFFQGWLDGAGAHGCLQQLHALLHERWAVSHGAEEYGHSGEGCCIFKGKLYVFNWWYAGHVEILLLGMEGYRPKNSRAAVGNMILYYRN